MMKLVTSRPHFDVTPSENSGWPLRMALAATTSSIATSDQSLAVSGRIRSRPIRH